MKTLVIIMLVLLVGLAVGCEQLAQVQDEEVTAVQATPMPPATPEQPKEAGESGARPSTPSPAATPEPADTPISVTTPLAVLPSVHSGTDRDCCAAPNGDAHRRPKCEGAARRIYHSLQALGAA